ncbi:hypothetical protein C8C99_1908 [Acidovorax sp. 107]|uniref:hypothetical protein n=1 Tax=Acidovorax sp. 107 TaxID=2135638 RepID=UPI000D385862|nr:hypothetical protein [Acidovorax sp. 107]PUA97062.1 hypothetical protein C8C99_1908 [Acidovorax sp. 107]
MALPPKTPPRFVPTLTEVVQVPDAAPLAPGASSPAARTTVLSPSQSAAMAKAAAPAVRPRGAPPAAAPSITARPVASPVAAPWPAVSPQVSRAPVSHGQPSPVVPPALSAGPTPGAASAAARALPDGMEEYMVHRVMQRVDVVLDQRLREAIATVVQEQTRSVLPRLREEIESVVRHAVYEAVADELASGVPPMPKG